MKYLKGLLKSGFVRNVFIVATGAAGAQVITMAFAPIITRLYGPEAFGLLGTFTAILAITTPIAALTYPIAIVLPKSDKDALVIAKLSAGLAFGMAALLALVILLFGEGVAKFLSLQSISGFLLFIPLAMLLSAVNQILQQWLIRKQQYRVTARVAVIQALALNSIKASVGWFHPVGAALIVLATLGNALHTLLLWLGVRNRTTAHPDLDQANTLAMQSPTKTIKELAHRHRDFPLYRAPQAAINALSQSLPVLMLAGLFGPAAAGFYTLAKTIMWVPSTLIGKSVSDVLYPKITEAKQKNKSVFNIIVKTTFVLTVVGSVPVGVVVLTGPWLFATVFGLEWRVAGVYAQWLAPFFLFNFINRPSVASVPVLGIQGGLLIYEVFSTGIKVLGLLAGFYFFNSEKAAIALFSITGCVAYVFLIFWVAVNARRIERNERKIIGDFR